MLLLKLAEIFGDVARTAESLIALTGDDKIVPLEVEFDADGECRSVQIISEEKREFLNSSTAVPSLPPDSSEIQAIVNHLQLGN